jgi:hypothetical protein
MGQSADLCPLEHNLKEAVIFLCKAAFFVVFHVEGFDDPVSCNGLMEKGGDGAHSLLTLAAEFPEPLSKFLDGDDDQREDEKSHERKFPITVNDNANQSDDSKSILYKPGDGIGDRSLNQIDIIGDS